MSATGRLCLPPAARSATRLPAALLALALVACATSQPPPRGAGAQGGEATPMPAAVAALRQRILTETLTQIGRPYRYGGGDGAGFDCSGLAVHVYADAGIALPRTAAQQRRAGRRIPWRQARPGDLIVYRIDGGDHVVVYIGDGRAVHAPASGRTVSIAQIDNGWWEQQRPRGVRLLPD